MAGTVWWPEPNAGDIVWCLFPAVLGTPGPKPRPALVVKVFDDKAPDFWIEVAYGTSQKTNKLYAGEFLIPNQNSAAFKLAGLSYPTKFNFNAQVKLPFNSTWFGVPPGGTTQTPILGTLHSSLHKAAAAAYKAALTLKP
jgi:hypothetical protein